MTNIKVNSDWLVNKTYNITIYDCHKLNAKSTTELVSSLVDDLLKEKQLSDEKIDDIIFCLGEIFSNCIDAILDWEKPEGGEILVNIEEYEQSIGIMILDNWMWINASDTQAKERNNWLYMWWGGCWESEVRKKFIKFQRTSRVGLSATYIEI